jgi:hypothetical protein
VDSVLTIQDAPKPGGVAAPAGAKPPAGVPVWSSFMPPQPVVMGQPNRPLPQPGNQFQMMGGAVPPPPPNNVSPDETRVGHLLTV